MSDAYSIWRAAAAEGLAKTKTVRIVFPELAAALDGAAAAAATAPATAGPDPQPVCAHCREQWARSTIGPDGAPICGLCVGRLPFRPSPERDLLVRRGDWPKIGPINRGNRRR